MYLLTKIQFEQLFCIHHITSRVLPFCQILKDRWKFQQKPVLKFDAYLFFDNAKKFYLFIIAYFCVTWAMVDKIKFWRNQIFENKFLGYFYLKLRSSFFFHYNILVRTFWLKVLVVVF